VPVRHRSGDELRRRDRGAIDEHPRVEHGGARGHHTERMHTAHECIHLGRQHHERRADGRRKEHEGFAEGGSCGDRSESEAAERRADDCTSSWHERSQYDDETGTAHPADLTVVVAVLAASREGNRPDAVCAWREYVGGRCSGSGDQRGDCRERLIGAFGFASLDWETGTKVRRVGATAERLRQGGVDIAIFLKRFISHSLTNQLLPAADKGGVTVAWVDQGYGAAAVAEALRKALGAQLGLAA
jgi:hypothetical protein